MSWQIIKAPDHSFCIWSTVVDDIITFNGTKEEIIGEFQSKYGEQFALKSKEIIHQLEAGEKPYQQLTISFANALEVRTWNRTQKELDEINEKEPEFHSWLEKQKTLLLEENI